MFATNNLNTFLENGKVAVSYEKVGDSSFPKDFAAAISSQKSLRRSGRGERRMYSVALAMNTQDINFNPKTMPTSRFSTGNLPCKFVILCLEMAGTACAPFARNEYTGRSSANNKDKSLGSGKEKPVELSRIVTVKHTSSDVVGNALVQWSFEKTRVKGDRGARLDEVCWALIPGNSLTFWYSSDDVVQMRSKARLLEEQGKPSYPALPLDVDFIPAGTICRIHLASKGDAAETTSGVVVKSITLPEPAMSLASLVDVLRCLPESSSDGEVLQRLHSDAFPCLQKDLVSDSYTYFVRRVAASAALTLFSRNSDAVDTESAGNSDTFVRISAWAHGESSVDLGIFGSMDEISNAMGSICGSSGPSVTLNTVRERDGGVDCAGDLFVPTSVAVRALNCGTVRSCFNLLQIAVSQGAVSFLVVYDPYSAAPAKHIAYPVLSVENLFGGASGAPVVNHIRCEQSLQSVTEAVMDAISDPYASMAVVSAETGVASRLSEVDSAYVGGQCVGDYVEMFLTGGMDGPFAGLFRAADREALETVMASGSLPESVTTVVFRASPLYVYSTSASAAHMRDFPLISREAFHALSPYFSFERQPETAFGNVDAHGSSRRAAPPMVLYEMSINSCCSMRVCKSVARGRGWFVDGEDASLYEEKNPAFFGDFVGFFNATAPSASELFVGETGGLLFTAADGATKRKFISNVNNMLPLKRAAGAKGAATSQAAAAAPLRLFSGDPVLFHYVMGALAQGDFCAEEGK